MSDIWVYKADGSVQCQPDDDNVKSLDETRAELAQLIGDEKILAQEKRGPVGPVIALCGHPTGNVNAYKITPEGLDLLLSGIAGRGGFDVLPDTRIALEDVKGAAFSSLFQAGGDNVFPFSASEGGDRGVPWPFAALLRPLESAEQVAGAFQTLARDLTDISARPDSLSGLIGLRHRVYTEGDVITLDYWRDRVNFELSRATGRIARIWFG